MENKRIIVSKSDINYEVTKSAIFSWKLIEQKSLENGKSVLFFSREIDENKAKKLNEIEKKYKEKFIPLFAIAIPSILAFILVTIFLIYFLINKETIDKIPTFAAFFLPAGALLLTSVVLSYLRTKQIEKSFLNKQQILKEAQNEVNNLIK